jgi:hypothetical protein
MAQRMGRGGNERAKEMRNTYWANTGLMDDFGNLIEHDMDSLDLAAKSLTHF